MIKIIVADDHHVMRNGISSLLEKVTNFKILAEAASGREVIELIANGMLPDVILTDLNMPDMGGIALCEQLKLQNTSAKLILLSMLDHEKFVIKAFKAGADAYILKSVTAEELIFAIKHVNFGQQYICTELSTRLLNRLIRTPASDKASIEKNNLEFSDREIEIMEFISEGFTNQEIADKLFTSKRTIEGQRQILLEKTDTRNSAALIKYALINRIIH